MTTSELAEFIRHYAVAEFRRLPVVWSVTDEKLRVTLTKDDKTVIAWMTDTPIPDGKYGIKDSTDFARVLSFADSPKCRIRTQRQSLDKRAVKPETWERLAKKPATDRAIHYKFTVLDFGAVQHVCHPLEDIAVSTVANQYKTATLKVKLTDDLLNFVEVAAKTFPEIDRMKLYKRNGKFVLTVGEVDTKKGHSLTFKALQTIGTLKPKTVFTIEASFLRSILSVCRDSIHAGTVLQFNDSGWWLDIVSGDMVVRYMVDNTKPV